MLPPKSAYGCSFERDLQQVFLALSLLLFGKAWLQLPWLVCQACLPGYITMWSLLCRVRHFYVPHQLDNFLSTVVPIYLASSSIDILLLPPNNKILELRGKEGNHQTFALDPALATNKGIKD